MYPIPPSEHLVEMRKCRQCMIEFPITDKDMEFYSKVSPVLSIASFWKEVLRNEAEDFPVSESTKSLIAEWKVKILETWAGNPSPAIAGTPFQKGVFLIPPPTLCPDCRQQRRLAFRNERRLYKRKCDATGKDIISIYSPDKPYTVYHQDYWWSDAWDPMSYGREFDFRKSAMENFREIFDRIPKANLWIRPDMINCEYCNFWSYSKNCYMSTASHHSENCLNTNTPVYCISDIDGVFNIQGNNIYECIKTTQCTNVFYSQTCQICKNSWYLLDCIDCDECFGCVWLKHKQYYILNKRYTKIRFYIKISKILSSTKEREKFLKEFLELKATLPFRSTRNIACEHLYGDDTMNSKNSYSVYDCMWLVNSKYATISGGESTDLYDSINGWLNSQCCMETLSTITISHSHFSVLTYNSNFIYYSFHIEWGNHLFLCTGLRNKSYCILNRQYTKEEYEVLVPRIIEHMSSPQPSPEGESILGTDSSSLKERGIGGEVEWGEFFPASMSPFGYNETVAQEYYPLSREEVLWETSFWKEVPRYEAEDFQKWNRENPQSLRDSSFQKELCSTGVTTKLHFLRLRRLSLRINFQILSTVFQMTFSTGQ